MKTIELLDENQKDQLKEIIMAFWNRKIDSVSIKLASSTDSNYAGLEIDSNWLIQAFQDILDEEKLLIKK